MAAMYHRIPAIYFSREFVEAGGDELWNEPK
jgi:hypothetical protein